MSTWLREASQLLDFPWISLPKRDPSVKYEVYFKESFEHTLGAVPLVTFSPLKERFRIFVDALISCEAQRKSKINLKFIISLF